MTHQNRAARLFSRLVASIQRVAVHRHQAAVLQTLDDRMLRDVGLTRNDVRRAPHWTI